MNVIELFVTTSRNATIALKLKFKNLIYILCILIKMLDRPGVR